jgi:hypothetical protein
MRRLHLRYKLLGQSETIQFGSVAQGVTNSPDHREFVILVPDDFKPSEQMDFTTEPKGTR